MNKLCEETGCNNFINISLVTMIIYFPITGNSPDVNPLMRQHFYAKISYIFLRFITVSTAQNNLIH